MKKVILLSVTFAIFSFVAVKSQNIVVNGDMESWTGGAPDGWTKAENISQEAIIIHGGNYSAKHTSDQTTKDLQQDISGIQGGQDYTINYWYLDNDPEARTRIWSYWLSGVSTLPDHVEILRPSTYSEDNPNWQEFNVVLTAPASADGFRFEVRVYKQDDISGGSVYYDDFVFSGDIIVDPEPSNYPTNFTATASNLSIDLSWTDATGTQLPSAYIIMAGIDPSLPVPIDGTPVPDDTDLSDGNGALNISYGVEEATFANLEGNTTYYFTIYPYTNSGSNIDFKTDGTAPAANAITSDLTIIEFENFDVSWGNWTTISVVGEQVWDRDNNYGLNNTPCARMNGYAGGPVENDDWLISPAMDFDNYDNETLVFYNAKNYDGPDMECKISTDYNGGGDPYSATWTTLSYIMTPGSWEWTFSGEIDISGFNGSAVYVAFQYTSTSSEAATWEVDDISITGEEDIIILPEPSNYPTNFAADASGTTINLSWTDAVGTQLPDKYIIFAGIDSSLPVPVDGTPVPDDPDLSDGSGALNVAYGLEEGSFGNLDPNTTYYFSIYSYTNSGSDIDYKNDGTAPTANATITLIPEPSNYPTNFNADATVTTINLSWTDAIGTQLPDAYIIFAGIDSSLPVPVDGTPVPDDPDLSDGSGALNVAYGLEEGSFDNLDPNTTYYFSIYPYTNSGSYIDFKNDGVAPTANATITLIPEPSNYPTNFNADVTVTTINLSWTDAIGTQLPDAYIIFAGINSSLPVPADGTPVPDDPDLSDGSGALNVNYGIEEGSFGNL
ncbi:MAG: choice-of-anchor J domain-containing protein, partial [Bacteroidales bacterium]|nr:choice-of-anchor J domain-containing protein [Bacteroidales bacterium]